MISAQAQIKMNELTENQLKSKIKTVEQLNRGTTAYTQKLDSVIMNYGPFNVGLTFEYDNLFNTTRVVLFGPGNPSITEYTYDNQNHRIGSIITHPNGSQDRTEYTYNSQGLVIKETQYELDNGEWEEDEQIIYEYDANGNLMVVTNYDYDILDWVYDEQTKYTYQNGKLTNELVYDWIIDEWVEDHSTDYLYNAQGDLVETIELDFDIDWIKDTRTEYTYDDNHNCLSQIVYDYDDDVEKVQAYSASMTLAVKVADMEIVGKVIDEAFAAGANTLNGISFSASDTAAAEKESLQAAVADARAKAEILAEAAGLKITGIELVSDGNVYSYDNSVGNFSAKRMEGAAMDAGYGTMVQAAKLIVSASVSITFTAE